MFIAIEAISLGAVTIAVLVFGIIVLLRRQYNLTSRLIFFVQSIFSAIWTTASIVRLYAADVEVSLVTAKVIYIAAAAIMCAWIALAISFSKFSKFTFVSLIASIVSLILIALCAIIPEGIMIESVATPPSRIVHFGSADWVYPAYITILGLLLTVILTINFATAKSRLERIRHSFVLFAVIFSILVIGGSDVFLPYLGIFDLYWIGPFALIILNFMMFVALFRYRLVNVATPGQNRLDSNSVIRISLHAISNTNPQTMLDNIIADIEKVDRISTATIIIFSNKQKVFSGNPKQALELDDITRIANSIFLKNKAIATEEVDIRSAEYRLFTSHQISALAIIGQPDAPVFGAIIIGNSSPIIYGEIEIAALASIANIIDIAFKNSNYLHENQELQQLDAAKDELLNIASHNLRTPLVVVRGYVELIMNDQEDPPPEKHLGYLNSADHEIIKMSRIIDDFLTLSRIQTGRFVLNYAPSDLRQIVSDEVASLRPLASNKDKKLELEISDGNYSFELDDSKIRQVVTNLIDNAIFYSNGSPDITVNLYIKDDRAIFEVEDHGIGVPEKDRDKLWQKFSRASNAQEVRVDGTGTGLYMVKRIIEGHGGTIIYHPLDHGSIFGFSLPHKTNSPE